MGNVLEEHFSYLSDGVRLERFREAVRRAVMPGHTVVDVGCGFGVLGLMCLEAGASRVWGVDETPAIEIARETMARSGWAERYTCLHDSSLRVALPQQVDVAICDHVGYFGFDYGIVRTMGDARARLVKPDGRIIPERIVLQIAAVQAPQCRALSNGWAGEPVPGEFHWLRDYAVNTKHPLDFTPQALASAPEELGTIDLRQDNPEHFSFAASLTIDRPCDLDGLGGWFECEIADGVWMTNSPVAPQRIDRAQAFLPFAVPLSVTAGDSVEVTISVRHETALISWSARVSRTGQSARQSTWASTILGPADRVPVAERIPRLSPAGEARRALLGLIDGRASNAEIERAMLRDHAGLFPTPEQIARFVRSELYRSTH